MLVWLFLALLLLAARVRVSAAAAHFRRLASVSHLRMLAAAHLSVTRAHLLLHMLVAAAHPHPHLLLMMLSIHLLLTTHHLLIHGILAVTGAAMFDSLVVLPGLVSLNVLVDAVKIFSTAFISGVLVLTFFAVFFTAHSCPLTLMFSEVSRSVFAPTFFSVLFAAHSCSLTLMFAKLVASSCSCRTDFLSAPSFRLVE